MSTESKETAAPAPDAPTMTLDGAGEASIEEQAAAVMLGKGTVDDDGNYVATPDAEGDTGEPTTELAGDTVTDEPATEPATGDPAPEAKTAEVKLDETAVARAKELDEARKIRDEISSERASFAKERAAFEEAKKQAAQDPLAHLASLMGLDNKFAAYEALSHQVAKGAPPPPDPVKAMQAQIAEQKARLERFEQGQSQSARAAEQAEVHEGILDIINDGEYPLVKRIGAEKVREAVFSEVVREYEKTGKAPLASDIIQRYEEQIRADWMQLAAEDSLLSAADLRRAAAEAAAAKAPSDSGQRPAQPVTTLTNAIGESRPEEDEDYWKDDDKLVAAAVAAMKGG